MRKKHSASLSFHSVILNFFYVGLLVLNHYLFPYIHELVLVFFSGWFLLLSALTFFFLNLFFRTSSISLFSYFSILSRVIVSNFLLFISLVLIAFITNTTEIIERDQFIKFHSFLLIMQIIIVFVSKYIYQFLTLKATSNIALITNSSIIDHNHIINSISKQGTHVSSFNIGESQLLIEQAVKKKIESVYIYLDSKHLNHLQQIFEDLSIYSFAIFWILPESVFSKGSDPQSIKPIPLNSSPVYLDTNQYLLKRSLDVFVSLALLIALMPLIVGICISIKLTDRGPIFYTQARNGQYGKVFEMIKFRSMLVSSDLCNDPVKRKDARVTFVGKIMRLLSLDEIPQLLNILRGEMSLVGPRPHTLYEIDTYSRKVLSLLTRHHVKPGLTGLAQIRQRGKANSVSSMEEKLKSDLEYINQWSFYLDLKILLNTPISLWKNRSSNT